MTMVKICGITRVEDAITATMAGADFIGLVFVPSSPRRVEVAVARKLVRDVRGWLKQEGDLEARDARCVKRVGFRAAGDVVAGRGRPATAGATPAPHGTSGSLSSQAPRFVGVFVDEDVSTIRSIAAEVGLDIVQMHGNETNDEIGAVVLPVIKAFRVKDRLPDAAMHPSAAWLLFDAHVDGVAGGTGRSFDWQLASASRPTKPFFLAGGVTPANVAEAVRRAHPYAIDVSSGVEERAGVKDPAKIRRLFQEIGR